MSHESISDASNNHSSYENFLKKYIPGNDDFAEAFFATVKLNNPNKVLSKNNGKPTIKEGVAKSPKKLKKQFQKSIRKLSVDNRPEHDRHWLHEMARKYINESVKLENLKNSELSELRKFLQGHALLQGLNLEVAESKIASHVGKSGTVIHESRRTVVIVDERNKKTMVLPKVGLVFVLHIPTSSQDCVKLRLDGSALLGCPSKRTKTT